MGDADFLALDLGAAPPRGIADWLSKQIRDEIVQGVLARDAVLPPSRQLATDLGVSRGVVVEAYRRLTDEGLIDGRAGVGTVVVAAPKSLPREVSHTPEVFGYRCTALLVKRNLICIQACRTSRRSHARRGFNTAETAVLKRASALELGYGDPRGNFAARTQLARWLGVARGVQAHAEDIIVVSGVAQSLSLISQVLQRRGIDQTAIEDPGSRGARDSIEYSGMTTIPVAVDADGLDVDALHAAPADVVVVTPAHQFPHHCRGRLRRRAPLRPLAGSSVARIGAGARDVYRKYLKTMAPGLRLGWLIAPAQWQEELVGAKHAADLGSPTLPQLVFTELLTNGRYERHLRAIRQRQRARRDAFLDELRDQLPEIRVSGVAAGLHLVIELRGDPGTDAAVAGELLQRGVLVHPLSWHRQRPGPPGLVIGYAALSADRLREAARIVADVIGSGQQAS